MLKGVIVVVLDRVGISDLPDAVYYGYLGVNTIANIIRQQEGFFLSTLGKIGLGSIEPIWGGN